MTSREEDDEFPCNWPGCFASRKGRRKPRGWAHCGYTMCCPEHAAALMATDVKIEDGWSCGPSHSMATIGVEALSEKGETFLTAYFTDDGTDDDDAVSDAGGVVASGSLLPEECGRFKRMAAAAGVKLLDWTKPGGSQGLQILAEAIALSLGEGGHG